MIEAPNALPSQATRAPGSQDSSILVLSNFELTSDHIARHTAWQSGVFPDGEPLSRQLNQYISESGEVGEIVFGKSPEELEELPLEIRSRLGAEITDQVIAALGGISALGDSYEDIRRKKERTYYNPHLVTE